VQLKANKLKKILVTGGLGYVGSHTVIELLNQDHKIIILDNLSNSSLDALEKIKKITNKGVKFYEGCISNELLIKEILEINAVTDLYHFAGLKSVKESLDDPLKYYQNNLCGTVNLLSSIKSRPLESFIFSSSATVYGYQNDVPIKESALNLQPSNPYGKTKLMIEDIVSDLCSSGTIKNAALLRYFNPLGAHCSGILGEKLSSQSNNILPMIVKVALGISDYLEVYGTDYDTPDGSTVRDFIHIKDLADAHVSALKTAKMSGSIHKYNIGTGKGTSILELIKIFETVNKVKIPIKFMERRKNDIPISVADCNKISAELGWKAKLTVENMCRDAWSYYKNNEKLV